MILGFLKMVEAIAENFRKKCVNLTHSCKRRNVSFNIKIIRKSENLVLTSSLDLSKSPKTIIIPLQINRSKGLMADNIFHRFFLAALARRSFPERKQGRIV